MRPLIALALAALILPAAAQLPAADSPLLRRDHQEQLLELKIRQHQQRQGTDLPPRQRQLLEQRLDRQELRLRRLQERQLQQQQQNILPRPESPADEPGERQRFDREQRQQRLEFQLEDRFLPRPSTTDNP
ncbi:MAG: hypothetical protein M3Z21_02780 [Pseudomonadota bacterium]|nr:hypothetical protein [Pseudomonadota bacterium]